MMSSTTAWGTSRPVTPVGSHPLQTMPVSVIPSFYAKTKYSSHVCSGSFIPHRRMKSVHIKSNVTNKVYLLDK
jgi:hypothetical protein